MATAEFKATAGTVDAVAQPVNLIGAIITDSAAADTAVGTVVSDNTTTLADIDAFGAAVIAITGDTYAAHQFGGAATTGLTSAQCNTLFKSGAGNLNAAITAFLQGQTDTNTAKAATAQAKTDGTNISADMSVYLGNIANLVDMNVLEQCWRRIKRVIMGTNILPIGSGSPRNV